MELNSDHRSRTPIESPESIFDSSYSALDTLERSKIVSYRDLVESLKDIVFVLDEQGIVKYLNSAVEAFSGYQPEVFLNHSFLRFVLREDRAEVERRFIRLSAGEHVSPAIFRTRIKSGEKRWVRASLFPVIHDGEFQGVRGVLSDLTEIKRAEEIIAVSEERYRRLFHNTSDAIYLWDVNPDGSPGHCIDVNDVALRLTQYSRSEVLKLTPFDLDSPELQERLPDIMEKLHEEGVARFVMNFRAKNGEQIPFEVNAHLFTLQNRKVILSVNRDIRERQRAELEKSTLEERLRESQKLESLGLLAGGIAHDFNNLLVGILGSASILMEEPIENPRIREATETIFRSAKRAAEMTHQMLAYAGKGHYEIRHADIAAMVREMASLLKSSLPKKASLELKLEPELPEIMADVSQINQLIMNLVINGAEALMEGPGTVHIGLQKVQISRSELNAMRFGEAAEPGTYVELTVRDDGIGMERKTLERIFDPFFTTKFTGRGLGLAMVFGTVRSHHGAMQVTSAPHKGTTFRILLPAIDTRAETVPVKETTASQLIACGKVLVVDDEEAVRTVARALLEKAGHEVAEAFDGEEALEIIRNGASFDAILLDLMMPRMNGEEVVTELIRLGCATPVILSSGYSEDEAHKRFRELGFTSFLQKPYTYEELRDSVNSVMHVSR